MDGVGNLFSQGILTLIRAFQDNGDNVIVILDADTIDKVVNETLAAVTSERTSRVIDHESNTNMEKRKKEGYF